MILMRRVVLALLIFFLVVVQIESKPVYGQCSGVGNYCVGSVVQQWGAECFPSEGACYTDWDANVSRYSCNMDTCTVSVNLNPLYYSRCGSNSVYPSCADDEYANPTVLSCCLYGGGGGGGGGSYSCPGGTYSQRLDECRNECNAGWQSGGDCDPDPCGNNAQGDPKVCCHKGVCTPEKTQNFSFSCNSDNTVTLFLFKQKRNLSVLFKQTAFLCLKSFNIAPKTRFLA